MQTDGNQKKLRNTQVSQFPFVLIVSVLLKVFPLSIGNKWNTKFDTCEPETTRLIRSFNNERTKPCISDFKVITLHVTLMATVSGCPSVITLSLLFDAPFDFVLPFIDTLMLWSRFAIDSIAVQFCRFSFQGHN